MVFHRHARKLHGRTSDERTSAARSSASSGAKRQAPEGARRRLFLEPLESRLLMFGDVNTGDDDTFPSFPGNYYPPLYSQSAGTASFLSAPVAGDALSVALNYFQQNAATYGLTAADVGHMAVTDRYQDTGSGITHIYLQQTFNGLPVIDAVASINLMSNGRVITAAADFAPGLSYPAANTPLTPSITSDAAVNAIATGASLPTGNLTVSQPSSGRNQRTTFANPNISSDPIPAQLVYVPSPTGGVDLAWEIIVHDPSGMHWFDAAVAASGPRAGQVVRVSDWVDPLVDPSVNSAAIIGPSAFYNVFPRPVQDPLFGNRTIVSGQENAIASPFGWHDLNMIPGADSFTTNGNNVNARPDNATLPNVPPPNGGPNLVFDFPLNLQGPPLGNIDAATTNLFYWANLAHDVNFIHGFDEASGNFQVVNRSPAVGLGNDAIDAFSQVQIPTTPATPLNNAFMATPPDGQAPTLAMGLFGLPFINVNPPTDADFDATVISHEATHGTSNRLTGGPANANALNALQSGGMGEGWSDWFALLQTQKPGDIASTPRPSGMYILGQPITGPGIRRFPYSFDMAIDPLTLANYNGDTFPQQNNSEVHNAGEIWATVLWDMTWKLIDKYGQSPDLYSHIGGQNKALDLVYLGMKLQPANPSFLQARDAIIAADFALNAGANYELIWAAFARRGFGVSALDSSANSLIVTPAFDVPPPLGHVRGTVWDDISGDGKRQATEPVLQGITVYDDANNNSRLDVGEPSVVSNVDGSYDIAFLAPQTAIIRQSLTSAYQQTFPANNGPHIVGVASGIVIGGQDFGDQAAPGQIIGYKFNDLGDGFGGSPDGIRQAGEPGISHVTIFVDLNNDGKLSIVEPAAVTDNFGRYIIKNVPPGSSYILREAAPPGGVQTKPGALGDALTGDPTTALPFAYRNVVVTANGTTTGLDFGNDMRTALDFGDAPNSYGTSLAANGARAGVLFGFHLGAQEDGEPDAQLPLDGTGDNVVGLNDEDGVFISPLTPGLPATITVTVSLGGNSPGRLQGWIDYNQNGKFDSNEKVVSNLLLGGGLHSIPIAVPATAKLGPTFARFRYGYESDIGPTGAAVAGEVEDYKLTILPSVPIATPDVFPRPEDVVSQGLIKPNSVSYKLDVLANDVGTAFGTPKIVPGSIVLQTPDKGSTFTISFDAALGRQVILYTAGPGVEGDSQEQFTYQVTDGHSVSAPGLVTINVSLSDNTAIDDTFTLQASVSQLAAQLPVLRNDLLPHPDLAQVIAVDARQPGDLVGFGDPSPPPPGQTSVTVNGVTLSIDPVDPKLLDVSAPSAFRGTVIFKYQVDEGPANDDLSTAPSTRYVTVQIVDGQVLAADPGTFDDLLRNANYLAELDVAAVAADINGNPTDTSVVQVNEGDTFFIRVQSHDLRAGGDADSRGVQTAYLDLLLNPGSFLVNGSPSSIRNFVSPLPDDQANPMTAIVFDSAYDLGRFGQNGVANAPRAPEFNEVGAIASSALTDLTGFPNVFWVRMMARQATPLGQSLQLAGDPADNDDKDVVLRELPVNPGDPSIIVLTDEQVFLRPSTLTISPAGQPEFFNAHNPMDVNQDNEISPMDVLTVINNINAGGLRPLTGTPQPGQMIDTNMDGFLSPMDALGVVNYLNAYLSALIAKRTGRPSMSGGEGEAAGADLSLLATDDSSSSITTSSTTSGPTLLVTAPSSSSTGTSSTPAPSTASSTPDQTTSSGSTVDAEAADELYASLAQARSDLKTRFNRR